MMQKSFSEIQMMCESAVVELHRNKLITENVLDEYYLKTPVRIRNLGTDSKLIYSKKIEQNGNI